MQSLRTAILEHTTADGVHHDWLIEDPRLTNPHATDARLWTARVLPPPAQWAILGEFKLEVLPPHRRAYLDYQGPVSGNRGHVRRIAAGNCLIDLWSAGRIALTMQCDGQCIEIQLHRLASERWAAVIADV